MASLLLVSLLGASISAPFERTLSPLDENAPILNDELIDSINEQDLGWKAARNPRFEGMSLREAKRLLGITFPESSVSCTHHMRRDIDVEALPKEFDSRKQWPEYIHPIRNQEQCGSCWAFAASEMLSDRFAIFSNGSVNEVLSPQGLVSCDPKDMGCNGGWPQYAADFLVQTGIPTEKCEPYASAQGSVPACPSKCKDGSAPTYYKLENWEYCTGEAAMMNAVFNQGPIAISMAVYNDFFSYSQGVYKWDRRSGLAGYHAIKLLGWGDGYWIVANSWGTTWGEAGYFRIAKGSNECGVELGALDRACPLGGVPLL